MSVFLELLGHLAEPESLTNRELLAFYTTFTVPSLTFLGPFEGQRGILHSDRRFEPLVGGQPTTLAARIVLLPSSRNVYRVKELSIQSRESGEAEATWKRLVRDSELLPQRLWGTLSAVSSR